MSALKNSSCENGRTLVLLSYKISGTSDKSSSLVFNLLTLRKSIEGFPFRGQSRRLELLSGECESRGFRYPHECKLNTPESSWPQI